VIVCHRLLERAPAHRPREPVGGIEYPPLQGLVVGNEIGHPERGTYPAWKSWERAARARCDPGCGLWEAGFLELASGAFHGRDQAVAPRLAPSHQRATLAQVADARQMIGGDDADAEIARGFELEDTQARRKRVHVEDVRSRVVEIREQMLGAACGRADLRFVTRRLRRGRVAKDGNTIVLGVLGRFQSRQRSGDGDTVVVRALALGESGDVDLGTAETLGKIPAQSVEDLHCR